MSFQPSGTGNIVRSDVNIDIRGSGSPDGKWTIIPDNVPYGQNIKWTKARYGMKWTEIREQISKAFMSKVRDSNILRNIRNIIKKLGIVPVRSGFLLNHIFSTMRIIRRKLNPYNAQFVGEFQFAWPYNRPQTIQNPRHSPPETGYGEWSNVRLKYNIPNVNLLKITPGGNALYLLNDPRASPNPKPDIKSVGMNELFDDFVKTFEGLVLKLKIGVPPP